MKPVLIAALLSLSLPACVVEETSLSEAESAIALSSATSQSALCEGYTGGGGQRVRGRAQITRQVSPASGGGYYVKFRLSVSAENWKKNFGWNTKRTTQLRIVGVIDNVPCYGFTPSCMGYIPIDLGTGGNLTTLIGSSWDSQPIGPVSDPGLYDFVSQFNLTFYGRDGTSCSM